MPLWIARRAAPRCVEARPLEDGLDGLRSGSPRRADERVQRNLTQREQTEFWNLVKKSKGRARQPQPARPHAAEEHRPARRSAAEAAPTGERSCDGARPWRYSGAMKPVTVDQPPSPSRRRRSSSSSTSLANHAAVPRPLPDRLEVLGPEARRSGAKAQARVEQRTDVAGLDRVRGAGGRDAAADRRGGDRRRRQAASTRGTYRLDRVAAAAAPGSASSSPSRSCRAANASAPFAHPRLRRTRGQRRIAAPPRQAARRLIGAPACREGEERRDDLAEVLARRALTERRGAPRGGRAPPRGRRPHRAREPRRPRRPRLASSSTARFAIAAQRGRRELEDLIARTPADGLIAGTARSTASSSASAPPARCSPTTTRCSPAPRARSATARRTGSSS